MNDEIGRRLREAAETHQPDHDRILARVQRGVTATTVRHRAPKPARSWPKVVLAGSAAAGILAVAGLAVAGVVPVAPARPEATTTLAVPTTGVTPSTSTTPAARPTGGSALPPASGHPDRPTTGRSS
ncbi:hypothetical protein ABT262_41750, partial [Amycolatopsis mediterranei]